MSHVDYTVEIKQPVEQVFDYLADLRHMTEWAEGVVSAERVTAEPPGPGTVYVIAAKVGSRVMKMSTEITKYVPGQEYESVTRIGPIVVDDRWEFTADGPGTRVRQVTQMKGKGLLAPVAALAGALLGSRIKRDLKHAAKLLNEGAAAIGPQSQTGKATA